MLLGVIADDFTGASDIANTLAKGGLATVLHLGLPEREADPATEAGVVALKSRSIPAEEAIALSLQALQWLRAQGCRQIVFKICSTFDSTPEGNVGPVSEALARALDAAGVPVCPAFPATGRTVYQGHLFVGDRLLSESGMERHPLNPMTDPDLRRWLGRQTAEPVGLVPWRVVREGPAAIRAGLDAAARSGERLAIVDAIADDDLMALGEAYPDLKADENFRQLQTELSETEDKLAAARRFFNNAVSEYNAAIQSFPALLFSRLMGFLPREFFDLGEGERQRLDVAPQVKF